MSFYVLIESDTAHADAVIDALLVRASPVGLAAYLDTVVDPWVRNRIEQRFDTEGDDVSGAWDPLTVATQTIRASYGFPPDHPINVRTGSMRSFLVGTNSDVKANGFGADLQHPPPSSDAIMNKKISTAQSGHPNPNTPARPVLGLNENDMLFITSSLAAWLTQDMI